MDFASHELELDLMKCPDTGKALAELVDGNERDHGADTTIAQCALAASKKRAGKAQGVRRHSELKTQREARHIAKAPLIPCAAIL
ncbi:hypothetical protein [Paraburkholderia sp. GAS334]|uniref:hypothetical protein n=1 Tax=Paraburkholderia sp. GAS334 TaxID=3035131 RepID=UPI003D23B15F